jgi:hypothetical protein
MVFDIVIIVLLVITIVVLLFRNYRSYDGQVVITTAPDGKKLFTLELDRNPDEIENMKRISFKVTSEEKPGYNEIAD